MLDLPSYGSSSTVNIKPGSIYKFKAVDEEVPAGILTITLLDYVNDWTVTLGSDGTPKSLSAWSPQSFVFCSLSSYLVFDSYTASASGKAKVNHVNL